MNLMLKKNELRYSKSVFDIYMYQNGKCQNIVYTCVDLTQSIEILLFKTNMSEPGKYVLLRTVQALSKKIKKAKPKNDKQLKKKLQNELKKSTVQIPKQGKNLPTNDKNGKKKNKKKQKPPPQAGKKTLPQKSPNKNVKNQKPKAENLPKPPKVNEAFEEPKTFHDDLAGRLKASRFRFINEQLYTQNGDEAIKVFNEDDAAFDTYHEGYRIQVKQWPINPLDRIIKSIKKL